MKKKQKLFLGFAIVLIMAIITVVGCDLDGKPEFPSEFRGTWKRAYQSVYTNTLTFTSNTIQDSTQNYHWELKSVSGDAYTIKASTSDYSPTSTIKYENGYLVFYNDSATGEHDWTGKWEKR